MDKRRIPHLNARLRQARLSHNWSQQDLADLLGTTIVTVNRWERSIQQPGPFFRVKLCALFGKSAEELGLSGDEADAVRFPSDMLEKQEYLPTWSTHSLHECLSQAENVASTPLLSDLDQEEKVDSTPLPSTTLAQDSVNHPSVDLQTLPASAGPTDEASLSLAQTKKTFARRDIISALSRKRLAGLLFIFSLVVVILLVQWVTPVFLVRTVLPAPKSARATVTLPAISNRLLYEAQWSKGTDHWSLSAHCMWISGTQGEIVTDGGNGNDVLTAPYTLPQADYALEVSIKRIAYTHLGGDAYGLVVRNSSQSGGYIAGVGVHFLPEHFFLGLLTRSGDNGSEYVSSDLARTPAHLDIQWHTYRIEVRRFLLRFLVDGIMIAQSESHLHTQAGKVGIYIDSAHIAIGSFKIFSLT